MHFVVRVVLGREIEESEEPRRHLAGIDLVHVDVGKGTDEHLLGAGGGWQEEEQCEQKG